MLVALQSPMSIHNASYNACMCIHVCSIPCCTVLLVILACHSIASSSRNAVSSLGISSCIFLVVFVPSFALLVVFFFLYCSSCGAFFARGTPCAVNTHTRPVATPMCCRRRRRCCYTTMVVQMSIIKVQAKPQVNHTRYRRCRLACCLFAGPACLRGGRFFPTDTPESTYPPVPAMFIVGCVLSGST